MQNPSSINLNADDPILRLADVERQTGLSKSSIYRGIEKGTFPAAIKLGERASGWLLSEINQWKQKRIEASRGGN